MENFSFDKIMLSDAEENKVFELGLLMEMDSENQYNDLKEKLVDFLNEMFAEKVEFPDMYDYLLLESSFETKFGLCGSIAIDIYSNDCISDDNKREIFKYLQETTFRVISELEGSTEEFYFPMNLEGFMGAMKKYNELVIKKQAA